MEKANGKEAQAEAQKPPPKKPSLTSRILPSWLVPALKNRRMLKTWARCIVVLLAVMILMVNPKTLNVQGNSAFFSVIVAFMLPPSMALSLYIFVCFILLFGMMLGWAWGVAAMAAGNAVRNQSFLAMKNQEIRSIAYLSISSTSAVYGVFLFLGTFFFAFLRTRNPALTIMTIFATIVVDVMCCYGPSFPTAQYTLAKSFIIPATFCLACSIASLIFIFPESMNHVWLTRLSDGSLKATLTLLDLQKQLITSDPKDLDNWKALLDQSLPIKRAIILGAQELKGQVGFANLEISVGRLGPEDLKKLQKRMELFIPRVGSVLYFFSLSFTELFLGLSWHSLIIITTSSAVTRCLHLSLTVNPATPTARYTNLHQRILKHENDHGHTIEALLPTMAELSADLRTSCEEASKALLQWIQACNSGRWTGFFKIGGKSLKESQKATSDQLAKALKQLEDDFKVFREEKRVEFLQHFQKFFDEDTGQLLDPHMKFSSRTLFLCFTYSESLEGYADAAAQVLRLALELDGKRPSPRIWFPSGFGAMARKIASKHNNDSDDGTPEFTDPLSLGSSQDPTRVKGGVGGSESDSTLIVTEEEDTAKELFNQPETTPRNPDARPARTFIGRFFGAFGDFLRFLRSPEGIFCLRTGVITIALWIPGVVAESAWFNYGNRGLWALIMAQLSLAVYAGDQISSVIIRTGSTIVGLLIGIVAWYIGAQKGLGNPYGVVAATVVLSAPFLLGRIAAPPQELMVWILVGVTIIFVVGYSWVDNHIVQVSNAGVGIEVAWKRALLVIIGFFAGFLVMLFPTIQSSRTLVRRTLSATMVESGVLIRNLVEVMLAEERLYKDGKSSAIVSRTTTRDPTAESGAVGSHRLKKLEKLTERLLGLSAKFQLLAPSLKTARWEPQLSGKWPHKEYEELYDLQAKLIFSIALLMSTLTRLESRWCAIMVTRTPFMNPNFLSDFFGTFQSVSAALAAPHPLARSQPMLRDRLIYHERFLRAHGGHDSIPASSLDQVDTGNLHVDGSSIGLQDLNWALMLDDQLPVHSTAVTSVSNMVRILDEMVPIVRDLCGTTSFHGYDELYATTLQREEDALRKTQEK
ncbi:hypothetical protein DL96DRAFT_1576215 [Flagelloscypha sp. PMI_526]|nr:hypothetical protein DL96DRAFT_1576215 [Flagelloscypha sp. PMI_526]